VSQRGDGADGQTPALASGHLVGLRDGPLGAGQRSLRAPQKPAPDLGQLHAPGISLQEFKAELVFEVMDLPA
jgi:hypothetical protein